MLTFKEKMPLFFKEIKRFPYRYRFILVNSKGESDKYFFQSDSQFNIEDDRFLLIRKSIPNQPKFCELYELNEVDLTYFPAHNWKIDFYYQYDSFEIYRSENTCFELNKSYEESAIH
jgi:hypothetical protein